MAEAAAMASVTYGVQSGGAVSITGLAIAAGVRGGLGLAVDAREESAASVYVVSADGAGTVSEVREDYSASSGRASPHGSAAFGRHGPSGLVRPGGGGEHDGGVSTTGSTLSDGRAGLACQGARRGLRLRRIVMVALIRATAGPPR